MPPIYRISRQTFGLKSLLVADSHVLLFSEHSRVLCPRSCNFSVSRLDLLFRENQLHLFYSMNSAISSKIRLEENNRVKLVLVSVL